MASRATTRLGEPAPARVRPGPRDFPAAVAGRAVDCVLEDWLVEDRWWTGRPLRRRYFECVLEDGRNVVVFHDLVRRRWFQQRA
jgi:hypothetical protein